MVTLCLAINSIHNKDYLKLLTGNKKLRKTEEKNKETVPKDRFDVHAVMTRAFDMRRKVIEDSESEDDDDEEDDWGD